MPASFQFPDRDMDVWVADDVDAPWRQSQDSGAGTPASAASSRASRSSRPARISSASKPELAEQYPDTDRGSASAVEPLKETVIGERRGRCGCCSAPCPCCC